MAGLHEYPFQPVGSSHSSFNSSLGATAALYALESTTTREWQFPSSRVVRVASIGSADAYIRIGTSDVIAASTNSVLVLGSAVEIFRAEPGQTHVSIAGSSTDVIFNFTLGIGN